MKSVAKLYISNCRFRNVKLVFGTILFYIMYLCIQISGQRQLIENTITFLSNFCTVFRCFSYARFCKIIFRTVKFLKLKFCIWFDCTLYVYSFISFVTLFRYLDWQRGHYLKQYPINTHFSDFYKFCLFQRNLFLKYFYFFLLFFNIFILLNYTTKTKIYYYIFY